MREEPIKLLLISALAVASLLAAGAASAQDFKSQAASAATRWDAAFNAGDSSKIAPLYAKNAVVLPPGGQQVTGPEGAQTLFGGFIKNGIKDHKITVSGAEMMGNMGYAYGNWTADAGGKKVGGHFTQVLVKEGEGWKTQLHTWTFNPAQ
jgi:ketosteroid isomerase-like protein